MSHLFEKDLQRVYTLCEDGDIDSSMEFLFDLVLDNLPHNLELVDQILHEIDVDKLDSNLCVTILSATLEAKESLQNRPALVGKVVERLARLGRPGIVDNLL